MANVPGYGFLYPARKKFPNGPSMSGTVTLPDGTVMDIAGWTKQSKAGTRYLSLKISEPYTPEPEQADTNDPPPF